MKKHYLFLIGCVIAPIFAYCISVGDLINLNPEKLKEIPIKDIFLIITLLVPLAKVIVRLTASKKDDEKLKIILKALAEFLPIKEIK